MALDGNGAGAGAGGEIRLIRRKQVPAVDGRHTRLTPLGTVAPMQIQMYLTSVYICVCVPRI